MTPPMRTKIAASKSYQITHPRFQPLVFVGAAGAAGTEGTAGTAGKFKLGNRIPGVETPGYDEAPLPGTTIIFNYDIKSNYLLLI